MTFRYCFKGPKVPSRPGGFWIKSGTFGNAFVIKRVNDDCTVFGTDGGAIYLDTEDDNKNAMRYGGDNINGQYLQDYYPQDFKLDNVNVRLSFCIIGEQLISSTNDHIGIGDFNQMFGFFSHPDYLTCPVLESPHGILYATKESIFIDLEDNYPATGVLTGTPPFVVDADKNVEVDLCVYDPSFGKNN